MTYTLNAKILVNTKEKLETIQILINDTVIDSITYLLDKSAVSLNKGLHNALVMDLIEIENKYDMSKLSHRINWNDIISNFTPLYNVFSF